MLLASLALIADFPPSVPSRVEVVVDHPNGLSGDPIHIRIEGLAPHERATVSATRRPRSGDRLMVAQAVYEADGKGLINLDQLPALKGSFTGTDPTGLFWSARPERPLEAVDGPVGTVRLAVSDNGSELAHAEVHLAIGLNDLSSRPAPFPGATLSYASGARHRPAVIVLGGSECGDGAARDLAPRLASRGFAVLGLPYCANDAGYPAGLPRAFAGIPADHVAAAFEWLAGQPEVDADNIGVYGISKGAEMALVAATRFPRIKAVVAVAPSDVVWEGWGTDAPDSTTSSFSWAGRSLPFVPYDRMAEAIAISATGARSELLGAHQRGRDLHPDAVRKATIDVASYRGRLLLIAGEDDCLWPSAEMARHIVAERRSAGLKTDLLTFPDAGHAIGGDGFASTIGFERLGGTPSGIAHAQQEAWQTTVSFLQRVLGAPATREVREKTFQGRLFLPLKGTARLGIVLIGGSEGHLYQANEVAPVLAQAGYAVLGVDYHDGYDGPRKLANVPIETFTDAATWLRMRLQPGARVITLGDSRGSEAALLAAAYDPAIAGAAAFVPSSVVWGALGSGDPTGPSGWSWRGRPLPFVPILPGAQSGPQGFSASMSDKAAVAAARLPLERIAGPVFLAGAGDDAVWPSAIMAEQDATIVSRRPGKRVSLVIYAGSGHRLLGRGRSSPTETYQYPGGSFTSHFGGTERENEQARNQAWKALAIWLRRFEHPRTRKAPAV